MSPESTETQHIFIIGSKGIPAQYGGFETFVENLTKHKKSDRIQYHIACASEKHREGESEFTHNNAHCYRIKWRKLGAARAVFYDLDALRWAIAYIKKNNLPYPVVYVLACRIGPFIGYYKRQIERLNGKLYINPDGHEWKRAKWSGLVRKYWKYSERLMVKHADLLICDSANIEKYIKTDYKKYRPDTCYIAYGAETGKSALTDDNEKLLAWYAEQGLTAKDYYLIVGRFVPENNYEIMIREFMKSGTKKSLALVTDGSGEFYKRLRLTTGFAKDPRIKFVGTVYNRELLKKIREQAYGYLHGHEVGGTNPSLLEALGSTELNLLLNVSFNYEVGQDAAVYWDKNEGDLARLIEKSDAMSPDQIAAVGAKARQRIADFYSWDYIVDKYEKLFVNPYRVVDIEKAGQRIADLYSRRYTAE